LFSLSFGDSKIRLAILGIISWDGLSQKPQVTTGWV